MEQLVAANVDAAHVANWQRARNRSAPRPKQVPRPGVKETGPKRLGKGRAKLSHADVVRHQQRWAAGELAGTHKERAREVI